MLRTIVFWLHLVAGAVAGVVVLVMSVTGVALTYEKQVIEWADRRAWSAPTSTSIDRLSPETLLAAVGTTYPSEAPITLTLRSDPAAPATVVLDRSGAVLVDPSTGAVIGPPPAGVRSFFRTMTNWHRWLAMSGDSRPTGKAITGASNLAFLFLVLSGLYLWVPRIWTRRRVMNVMWFRRGLSGKARDFNWHNVIGIWSALPLAIVVAGAVPISYGWATRLVYQMAGDVPPRPTGPSNRGGAGDAGAKAPVELSGIDAGYQQATSRVPDWRAITIRIPAGEQPSLVYTVDAGYGGQPQKRGTLTVARASSAVDQWEVFADQTPGRRLRSWFRFAHTGEYYGLPGQTLAGLASAGGVVLVYTGLALALRRFMAWRARRPATSSRREPHVV
jgi:uncharacterized iron-regulated membrane protein